MRIGLLSEDTTHDSLLRGLKARWCAGAVVVTGADAEAIRRARGDDPKGEVQAAFRRQCEASGKPFPEVVEGFVARAPLARWMAMDCFNAFYEECRGLAAGLGCAPLPNERDSKERTSGPT